ncbi:RNA-directed DNA polymerase, eukaryota [Tanacetum coccineum]|uniref:RNA-directed DNA polymerase, eukaryota n=1 Tax=Tanacetum coccineum TaxID=301880 RepID=A0ABQ5DI52_9ASTR
MILCSLNVHGLAQKAKKDWVKELCNINKVNVLSLQETKMENIELFTIESCWGNLNFDYVYSPSVGYSGGSFVCGITMVFFVKHQFHEFRITLLSGSRENGFQMECKPLYISIYAHLKSFPKECVLEEVVLAGCSFILGAINSAIEMWPILMREAQFDYGPIPFKFYHRWFEMEGFDSFVEKTWNEALITDSNDISKFSKKLLHLKDKIPLFGLIETPSLQINSNFPKKLDLDQQVILEREISRDEVKRAVWDCGTDKSPGPDGFTFGFYRRYWSFLDKDVEKVVRYFFHHGVFSKAGNSSFIALLPKVPNANKVNDFRPITLIGSLYKIISKILANRLVDVVGDIVNEVQSAFVANKQILDDYCEKAYDSVRWDYLDDVLLNFGFGERWRGWIQSCLKSSKGSVIVNGSPTSEFEFQRGLKQGDPLSPFLFILIMESLHISFQRVVDAGKWSDTNIDILVKVLDCFHKASGLRINMHKSKLMGISVASNVVTQALSIEVKLILVKSVIRFYAPYLTCLFSKVPVIVLQKNWSPFDRLKAETERLRVGKPIALNRALSFSSGCGDSISQIESCDKSYLVITVAEKVSHDSLGYSLRRIPRSGIEQTQLNNLSVYIEGVTLVDMRDRWSWSLDGSGEFSVASVRNLIDDYRLNMVSSKTRWSKAVPIKINVHAWKVKMDGLPTRFNISRRGMEIDSILCQSCGTAVESTSHIFFKCNLAKEIFHKITSWWDVDYVELSSYQDWFGWMSNLRLSSKHKSVIEGISYTMWWTIWNFRNTSIFGSKLQHKVSLFDDIVSRSFYWCKFRCKASFSWLEWLN